MGLSAPDWACSERKVTQCRSILATSTTLPDLRPKPIAIGHFGEHPGTRGENVASWRLACPDAT
jgi:hypothetical protein